MSTSVNISTSIYPYTLQEGELYERLQLTEGHVVLASGDTNFSLLRVGDLDTGFWTNATPVLIQIGGSEENTIELSANQLILADHNVIFAVKVNIQ